MACITHWYDSDLSERFIKQAAQSGGDDGVSVGDIAESSAVPFFDAYVSSMLAKEDAHLAHSMDKQQWTSEVRARAAGLVPGQGEAPSVSSPSPAEPPITVSPESPEQLRIPFAGEPKRPELATMRREREYKDTVWIPRILWALEWARQANLGAQTPADMARILTDYGQLDVPRNNVARAFRDLRDDERCRGLWTGTSKRYGITEAGTLLLGALLREDEHASTPSLPVT
jgi:hypothetical protein